MPSLAPAYIQPLETSARGDTGSKTVLQDQTTRMLELFFTNKLAKFQLASSPDPLSNTFDVLAGHSIAVGNIIELGKVDNFIQAEVITVATNTITINQIIGGVYPTGVDFDNSSKDMRVDGSSTPVIFTLKPSPGQFGDFTRILLGIQSTTQMDFSLFGGASALAKGCLFRVKIANGEFNNLFSWKTNGGFTIRSFDSIFQSKVAGGEHSFVGRSEFGGPSNRGVVIRLEGLKGEELQIVIQDDLTSGNTLVEIVGQGHELEL